MRRGAVAALLAPLTLFAVPVTARAGVAATGTVAVVGVVPASGTAGDVVTVTGAGLTAVTAVHFCGRAARYTVVDDGRLQATAPTGVSSGPLLLSTPDGPFTAATFTVRPAATTLALTLRPAVVVYPQPVTIGGRLARTNGAPVAGEPVQMWVKNPGLPWQRIGTLRTDAAGAIAYRISPLLRTAVRLVHPATAWFAAAATSESAPQAVDVRARDLGPGATGADVAALQQRLRALHYDVPAADGRFGYDTQHAVIAFQKAQRLARTGVVDATTRARLAAPRPVTVLHRVAGASVEIDLTRQVLLFARGGTVQRILDVSTGSGQDYVGQDGALHVAATPLGAWRVLYKVNALQHSPLGWLYRPAYFNAWGYAVHGSGSVPVYPASHGCVRVTNGAMDRLYDLLAVGTPVWVYRS